MQPPVLQPYLFFNGRCDEAIEFYQSAIGARLEMRMRFSEAPTPMPPGTLPAGFENKVMHAALRIGNHTLLASDGCGEANSFNGFSLSLLTETEAEARHTFDALSLGGEVTLPISSTFWSGCFGMLRDRFGVSWMVGVVPEVKPKH